MKSDAQEYPRTLQSNGTSPRHDRMTENEFTGEDIESMLRAEIVRMQPYVPGEQVAPGKVVKLNTNENPYPPSQSVVDAITSAATNRLQRYPDPSGSSFRIQASETLGVSPDQILCGNGSDDILTILTRAFVPAGGFIRFPKPSYILYRTLANIQGADYEEVPFCADFSLADAFFSSTPTPSLVFLPNPNSPSGTLISNEVIGDLADALPCPLVVDEAYVDFAPHSAVSLIEHHSNILVTRTMSKSYALAGLRFGFLIGQASIIGQLQKVKDSYNCDALSLAGATAAICDQPWLADNVAKIRSSRERLSRDLSDCGFTLTNSQANFVWCTHTIPLRPVHEFLRQNGVLVRYMNYEGWGEGLRISVGTEGENEALLTILRLAMNELA